MAAKQGQDYSRMLIWASALVGVVRYSAAFLASDMGEITGVLSMVISALLGLSGLGMGFLDTVGAAYLFDGWRRAMPKNGQSWPFRFRILTVFIVAIFGTGLGILVPFTVSRVGHATMANTLGPVGIWLWGLAVNLAPVLLIGGVATGQSVVKVAEQETNGSRTEEVRSEPFANRSRSFASLSESDKLFIINSDSRSAALEYAVTPRAVQKWRKMIAEEMAKRDSPGRL